MRLFSRRSDDERIVTLFEREDGVVCYETPLFRDESADWRPRRELCDQLLSAGELAWYWASVRDKRVDPATNLVQPANRPLTRLTTANSDDLVKDAEEPWVQGYERWICLLGVDDQFDLTALDSSDISRLFVDFAMRESEPIRIVVAQPGDMTPDYIFVPHQPVEAIADLLRRWSITGPVRTKRRPYKRLGVMQIEKWDRSLLIS